MVFLLLGIETVDKGGNWNTGFVLWTLFLIFIARFFSKQQPLHQCCVQQLKQVLHLGVFLLTGAMNRIQNRFIGWREQFVMAYSGLRGAIGFALAYSIDGNVVPQRELFITTMIVVVLFTVFIQVETLVTSKDFYIEKHGFCFREVQ